MRRAPVLLLSFLALGCRAPAPPPAAPAPTATPAPSPAPAPAPPRQRDDCGTRPGDWCAAPAGDPCGTHMDLTSCRADPRCGGRAYAGESLVACRFDARGFGENCPTVGCMSLAR